MKNQLLAVCAEFPSVVRIFISASIAFLISQVCIAQTEPTAASSQTAGHELVVRQQSSLWREDECKYDDGEWYCTYFRFYPDGTVIGVGTSGTPNEIKSWFRRPYSSSGTYVINDSKIRFSLTS